MRYRGILLNDEAPDLTNWVREKFRDVAVGDSPPMPAGVANYGRELYTGLFELLLRVRGNYLWPAMWNNACNEDDLENARLADEYGIVMGTRRAAQLATADRNTFASATASAWPSAASGPPWHYRRLVRQLSCRVDHGSVQG